MNSDLRVFWSDSLMSSSSLVPVGLRQHLSGAHSSTAMSTGANKTKESYQCQWTFSPKLFKSEFSCDLDRPLILTSTDLTTFTYPQTHTDPTTLTAPHSHCSDNLDPFTNSHLKLSIRLELYLQTHNLLQLTITPRPWHLEFTILARPSPLKLTILPWSWLHKLAMLRSLHPQTLFRPKMFLKHWLFPNTNVTLLTKENTNRLKYKTISR